MILKLKTERHQAKLNLELKIIYLKPKHLFYNKNYNNYFFLMFVFYKEAQLRNPFEKFSAKDF